MEEQEKKQRQSYLDGWRMFWPSCLGHHAIGALSAMLIATGHFAPIIGGFMVLTLYIAYQGLSVIRKRDSAGLDAADALYGFVPVLLVLYIAYPEGFPLMEYVREDLVGLIIRLVTS